MCATYLDLGKKYCSAKQIRESILIEKTKQILGLAEEVELTHDAISNAIVRIESDVDNVLRFFLKTGRVEVVHWGNPSRSKSWTPEMRRKAGEKTCARHHKIGGKGDK